MKKWFISYVWVPSPGVFKYENEITERHPFEMVRLWREKFDGNNESVLLSFYEIDEKTADGLEEAGIYTK